jgi:hypothetical protein
MCGSGSAGNRSRRNMWSVDHLEASESYHCGRGRPQQIYGTSVQHAKGQNNNY